MHDIEELHLSYEEGNSTVGDWLNKVACTQRDILLEALEGIGSYITDNDPKLKTRTEYDTNGMDDSLKPSDDDLLTGILKFANIAGTFASDGSISSWQDAVQDIAKWYVTNVTGYMQMMSSFCPLVSKPVRWDCSGFVTACLQKYGLLRDTNWPPSSRDFVSNANVAEKLTKGGFRKYRFTGWDSCRPYDIVCTTGRDGHSGHIEIYNGIISGRHTSWSWGSYHRTLPCGTAYVRSGYDVIWRCEERGTVSNILEGLTILDAGREFNFSGLHPNENNKADVCKACYQAFRDAGCTDAAAKGICANIIAESQMNPKVTTWDGNARSGHFGIGGGLCGFYYNGELKLLADYIWGPSGRDKLASINERIRLSGLPYPTTPVHPANTQHIMKILGGFPFSLQEQLRYIVHVLNQKRCAFIKSMTNASSAAMAWEVYYERPAHPTDRWLANGKTVMALLSK